jgi:DNA-binding Xre family transcriptional regulator
MSKSREAYFDSLNGDWRYTTPRRPGEVAYPGKKKSYKGRRRGRKPQYYYKPVEGRWKVKFIQKCRETGYVHTTGPHAGRPNIYRLCRETGLSRESLHKIVSGERSIGMEMLGKLCDVFHCQPNDFLERVTIDGSATPLIDLPDLLTEDDLPGDEYVHPSQL